MFNIKYKVTITDYTPPRSFEWEKKILKDIGAELVVHCCKTEDEIIESSQEADALLMMNMPATSRLMESLKKLKVIGRYGIGVDQVDLKAATGNGIIVVNVPDYCIEEVSDHAVALIINSIRKIGYFANKVRNHEWPHAYGNDIKKIKDSILGFYGFGNIPQAVARKMRGFNNKIIAFDPYVNLSIASKLDVQLVDFTTLLKSSDVLSIHCPLNDSTRKSLSYNEFKMMNQNINIVNTARGAIIDQQALCWALTENKIASAYIDVLEHEPPDLNDPLLKLENAVITPHMAYYSNSSPEELSRKLAENVALILEGGWSKNVVNQEVKKNLR